MKLRRHYLPIIPNLLHTTNQELATYGLQETMRRLCQKTNTQLQVHGVDSNLKNILQTQRVIIVANHPNQIEPLTLLAAMPNRQDVYVIVWAKFLNILSNLNKHLIPVYIQHHFGHLSRNSLRTRLFNLIPFNDLDQDKETAHQKNIESIGDASRLLDNGGLIIIFPQNDDENKQWFSGVGHMIKDTTTNEPIYVVNVHIHGTSKVDLLRILPFAGKVFRPIAVYFGKANKVNALRNEYGKDIAMILQKNYRKWARTI